MAKLVMGYWDCPYCEQTGIKGTLRECPSCGHPRDENTKFYMKKDRKQYLTKEESKTKGKGADWICEYCETLNSALDNQCKSCGAARTAESQTYFSRKTRKNTSNNDKQSSCDIHPTNNNNNDDDDDINNASQKKKINRRFYYLSVLPILLTIGIIISLLYNFFTPTVENLHVDNIYWKTTQDVETLNTYHESGWHIPAGGRQTDKKYVVKTYEKVLDHYETVQKTRNKQVIDHYETKYKYANNGDGTFTEHSYQEPVYRTETEYYTEQEPVYRDEPIYAWKYWYDIDRWKVSDKLIQQGEKDVISVTYSAVKTNEKTRAGKKYIQYFCDATYLDGKQKDKTNTYELSEELYDKIKNNTNITCKMRWGKILEIID